MGTLGRRRHFLGPPCPGGPPCAEPDALEPGGVDITTDGVVRIAAKGGFLEHVDSVLTPTRFTGAEEVRFHSIDYHGSTAWLLGDLLSLRNGNGSWTQVSNAASKSGVAANANRVFLFSDGEIRRIENNNPLSRLVETTENFMAADAVSSEVAVFVGLNGKILVVSVPEGGGDLGQFQMLEASTLTLDAPDANFSAVHVVDEGEMWLGTNDGRLFRYGLGAPTGWTALDGDAVDFDSINPDPDPEPDPDPDPIQQTLVRFIGVGLGNSVCNGSTPITGVLGERNQVSFGYVEWSAGTYKIDLPLPVQQCGGLGVKDFNLFLNPGNVKTVVVDMGVQAFVPVMSDDLTAPQSGQSRLRFWGRDRLGTGDLTDVEYCIGGTPVMGGSKPSTSYVDYPVGTLDVEVRIADGACSGELRDTFSLTLAEGETRSLFIVLGTKLGPVRELDDVYIINCLDSLDGEPTLPSNCNSFYATPAD